MRVRTTAVPGISMRGGFVSGIVGSNVAQGTWLLPVLSPGQNTNLPISGIAPAPTEVQPGISSAAGYGVYAELQEQTGDAGIVFALRGVAGRSNVVEATTNLAAPVVWLPLTTNAPASGLFNFTNFSRTNFPHRFYRAREL